jgi:hypothetical protein
MNEAALEALVPRLQAPYSRLRTAKGQETLTSENDSLSGRRTCFRCMNEGKVQAQPQLYGTSYLSVSFALTGQFTKTVCDHLH